MKRYNRALFIALFALLVTDSASAQAQGEVIVEAREVRGPVRATLTSNAPTVPVFEPVVTEQPQDTSDALPLRGSRRALSFTFDEFSLDGIDAGVGGKYWFGSKVALRASLRFDVSSQEDDIDSQEDRGITSIGFGAGLVAERHAPDASPFGRVSPYLAVGFEFGADAFSQSSRFPLDNPVQERRNDGHTLSFEVLAGFGVEYRVSRRVSLAGEHLFGARIASSTTDMEEVRGEEGTFRFERQTESFNLGTGTSSLILSVYF